MERKNKKNKQKKKRCITLKLGPAGHRAVKHNTLACQSGWSHLFYFFYFFLLPDWKASLWCCAAPRLAHVWLSASLCWCMCSRVCSTSCLVQGAHVASAHVSVSLCRHTSFPCVCTIDSILRIHKSRKGRRGAAHFDPLCKCNETLSPQALHIVCSDFSRKGKKKKKCKRSKNEPMHTDENSAISPSISSNFFFHPSKPHTCTHSHSPGYDSTWDRR